MARFLRDLLEAEEPLFTRTIEQLERASGQKNVDVRLVADIIHKTHAAMRELGLSPEDTHGREFYQALLSKVRRDNERIAAIIGGSDSSDARHMTPHVLSIVERVAGEKKAWVLKASTVRKILQTTPPLRLMQHLRVGSVEALLERYDIYDIYVALRFSEGEQWLTRFNDSLRKLTRSDFEQRSIIFRQLDHDMFVELAAPFVRQRMHNVAHSKEFGVIAIVPMYEEFMPGVTLKMLLWALHYTNEIRTHTSYFKLKKDDADFGRIITQVLNNDIPTVSHLGGQELHWRVVQRYFGAIDDTRHPEIFRPHIHPEDLYWHKAEEMLCEIDPSMIFWRGKEYSGLLFDGAPVTVNLLDINNSFSISAGYEDRQYYHFRENLWNEIFARYLGEDVLEYQMMANFGTDLVVVKHR